MIPRRPAAAVRRAGLVLLALAPVVGLWLFGLPAGVQPLVSAQDAEGRVLAVYGRQVAWLDLASGRPTPITSVAPPAVALDVGMHPLRQAAAVSLATPFNGSGMRGADIVDVDLGTGEVTPGIARTEAHESLTWPAWWPDGETVLFQREDLAGPLVATPTQEVARYPSRIEVVRADGMGRSVLVGDGREAGPAPDGSGFAFVRASSRGAALLVWAQASGEERTIVSGERFPDLASPRFAPAGDQIAFVSPQVGWASNAPLAAPWFEVRAAHAHGIPWDLWTVTLDGATMRHFSVGADEPSLAWAPDGGSVFLYGAAGSYLVDLASGDVSPLPRLIGGGGIAWPAQGPLAGN